MLIGINERNEIKQINVITDETLTQIEVDREMVFGNMSDFMILNYKYTPYEYGYSITPALDYNTLSMIDNNIAPQIKNLEEENNILNDKLNNVRTTHSDLIFDMDFRIMDIEDSLGITPMKISLFNKEAEVFMSSTFLMLLDKIELGNYNSKEEIESMADRYLSRNRITVEEYELLMKALDKKELEKNETEIDK